MTAILHTAGLTRRFGSVTAVDSIDLEVAPNTCHAVIGSNGAGKSTLFAMMAGTLKPTAGTVHLEGRDVTRMGVHRRAQRGLVKTFQHSSLFDSLTVRENAVLGAERNAGFAWRPYGGSSANAQRAAETALESVGLAGRAAARAGQLSHGERRQLELALAMSVAPRILLLDEPTAGMSAAETARFVDFVAGLKASTTILIIEHDLDVVLSLADTVTVMHLGSVIATGSPQEIRDSELVQSTYLGTAPAGAVPQGGATPS